MKSPYKNPEVTRLRRSIDAFTRCIVALPEELFRRKIKHWTPRDVVAHLIGWNRYTILGCEELRRGLEPFYYADAATDFKTVNAVSVRKYRSKVRRNLLTDLKTAFMELAEYLESREAKEWEADFGIRRKGTQVTIRNTVNALTRDYINHTEQIEAWRERVANSTPKSPDVSRRPRSRKVRFQNR